MVLLEAASIHWFLVTANDHKSVSPSYPTLCYDCTTSDLSSIGYTTQILALLHLPSRVNDFRTIGTTFFKGMQPTVANLNSCNKVSTFMKLQDYGCMICKLQWSQYISNYENCFLHEN